MTSSIPVALSVRRWMQSIHSVVRRAFSSLYWSIAVIASCLFVPITSEKICRPPRATRFRCACKKPTTNRTRFGWKKNDEYALDSKRLVRATRVVRGRNQFRSRDNGRFQTGRHTRDQKSARIARQNAGELFCRAEHTYAHLFRAGGISPEC